MQASQRATTLLFATLLVAFTTFLTTSFRTDWLYEDIYLRDADSTLTFGNSRLTLTFARPTGAWTAWSPAGQPGNLLTPSGSALADIDVSLDTRYVVGGSPLRLEARQLLGHYVTIDKDRRGATLALTVGLRIDTATSVAATSARPFDYELTTYYRLFPNEARIERTARLLRRDAGRPKPGSRQHFDGFRFGVPGVHLGPTAENTLTVPGPFFTNTFVRPGTPYDSLRSRKIGFHSAPDAGFGLLILENQSRNQALASFMDTRGEVAYLSGIDGNGHTISFRHDNKRAYYLAPGQAVESDVHHLALGRSVADALAAYQHMVATTLPPDRQTPAWVREQVILEIYPKYFTGGLKAITARLPFYKSVGFTMLYLMPHWTGGYSPIDPYAIDPRFGKKEELQALVRTAHGLGLKVIFDMVIHGFNHKSPVPRQRPELFVRTEADTLARHPTWGSITTDWASPAYQQYMVDLVLHDQRTYQNDGYRVDAATYKGAGWNPNVPYPAYRDGSAAPELMTKMLTALRRQNPDAVLLSEVFGPVFYTVCNFVHDNQTEAVPLLLEKMQRNQYTAEDYKRHLIGVFGAMAPGINRVFYARNHDTDWFYTFGGYTPRFMAFEAVHALFGIPEVFAGDSDYPYNPDDSPTTYAQYRRLFAYRKAHPAFVRGDVRLTDVRSSNPQVFSGLRSLNGRRALALVSFGDKPATTTISVSSGQAVAKSNLVMTDVYTGANVVAKRTSPTTLVVTLQPGQALAGEL